jgi:ATP synthase protein I
MTNKPKTNRAQTKPTLADRVGAKATRKLKARHRGNHNVWLGFGMMGLVGWSVAIPTVGGAALGIWLDKHYPGEHPWTLALLVLGLSIGCLIAWRWISKEHKAIKEEHKDDDE